MTSFKTVILILSITLIACSSAQFKRSDLTKPLHHTDSGFKNLYIKEPDKNFFSFLKMKYFGDTQWANHPSFSDQIPWQELDLNAVKKPSDKPQISWLGHSTFLIQYNDINILTDPVFCERTSPFSFMGPKRYTKHVVDYKQLPQIDYVIISHNHYDHLDIEAILVLSKQTQSPHYFVPLGNKKWLLEESFNLNNSDITEMDWGDKNSQSQLAIQALPSQHWSARSLFDRFETLWASWRVEIGDFSFWFAGDTGYHPRLFNELGEQMPAVDVALIPIGAYAPRDFMKSYHINPEEAVKIHQHIKTKLSIGMHWGTYPLTAELPTEPPIRLKAAIKASNLTKEEFTVMNLGETRVLN